MYIEFTSIAEIIWEDFGKEEILFNSICLLSRRDNIIFNLSYKIFSLVTFPLDCMDMADVTEICVN